MSEQGERSSGRSGRDEATVFVGGWVTPAQKTKLVALARFRRQSVGRILSGLIDSAAVAMPNEPTTTTQNRADHVLADHGAVPANI